MRDIFEAGVLLTEEQNVEKNAQAWEQKFDRLKSSYANYKARKYNSGTNGKLTLCKPPYSMEFTSSNVTTHDKTVQLSLN